MLQLSENLSYYAYGIQGIKDKIKFDRKLKMIKIIEGISTCELVNCTKQDNEHPSPYHAMASASRRLLHPYTYTHIHIKVCMSFFYEGFSQRQYMNERSQKMKDSFSPQIRL